MGPCITGCLCICTSVAMAAAAISRFSADEAADALIDDLGHRAPAEGEHRRAVGHGFDHDQPERLRPVDREQQRRGIPEKFPFSVLADFTDELDQGIIQQGPDHRFEICLVGRVDLGCDPQRDASALSDFNRMIAPLLGADPSSKMSIRRSARCRRCFHSIGTRYAGALRSGFRWNAWRATIWISTQPSFGGANGAARACPKPIIQPWSAQRSL
jgi:hypothetical protein